MKVSSPGLRRPDDYVIRMEVPAGIRRGGYTDRRTPDTVAAWDNRFTQHYALFDYRAPKRMNRLLLEGEAVHGIAGPVQ